MEPLGEMIKEAMIKRFLAYKDLGEKAIRQLDDQQIHWKHRDGDNSIYTIVKHMHGNMLSRFTDFMNSDGEKTWRKRDDEFKENSADKETIMQLWNEGWACVISALGPLCGKDMGKTVTIRGEAHTVADAILRQIAHYAYHVGQIVYLGKTIKDNDWENLSIPRDKSTEYNRYIQQKQQHAE